MRARSVAAIARCIGYAVVAAAIVAAAFHFRQQDLKPRDAAGHPTSSTSDRLAAELSRCEALGLAAKNDPACAAAWAENRRRFFGSAPAPDAPVVNAKPGQLR